MTGYDARIPSSQRGKSQIARVFDPLQDKANLVHVRVEHQSEVALPFTRGEQIPQRIGPHFIHVR